MAMGGRKRWERDADKERRWRRLFKSQAKSGLSVRAFCRREGVAESGFYWWRREIAQRDAEVRLQQASPASHFMGSGQVEVDASGGGGPSSNGETPAAFVPLTLMDGPGREPEIVIELSGGVSLRLPEAIPAARVAELVHALQARSASSISAEAAS